MTYRLITIRANAMYAARRDATASEHVIASVAAVSEAVVPLPAARAAVYAVAVQPARSVSQQEEEGDKHYG